MKSAPALRAIPSVEKLRQALGDPGLPRAVVVAAVRRHVAALRAAKPIPEFGAIVERLRAALADLKLSRLQPVINGTGILVHTNLGRAPLGPAAVATLAAVAADYNNLELDLATGARGRRAAYLEDALALLCGADAATVVNNCAAALVLVLRHFTSGQRKEVILSRGELIQIGGGFRVPEILEASGARLREVGTTNQTALNDYARAIRRETAMILKVHRSNFFMGGFVASPDPKAIAGLAKKHRLPFVEDLGSGAVVDTAQLAGLEHEPTPAEALRRGVDLVCFSGDKLLGGPQAGIIAGKARHVAALQREPFFRALRCDKLVLSALQTTVELYLEASGPRPASSGKPEVGAPLEAGTPVLAMLRVSEDELRLRAGKIVAGLARLPLQAGVGAGRSQLGGGTLPRSGIPSVTVELAPRHLTVEELARRLRRGTPPVVGFISNGRFKLDLRTVFPRQDEAVLAAVRQALAP